MKHPVLTFFLLALGIAWLGWIPYGASQAGLLPLKVPAEVPMFSQYGPFVAALILTGRQQGWRGVRSLLGRLGRWRVGIRWYLFVLLLTPAIAMATVGLHALLGGSTPDWSNLHEWWVKRADQMRFGGWNVVERNPVQSSGLLTWLTDVTASGPAGAAIVWVVMAIGNGGISEEPGWRGYALPRLQGRMSALRAGMAAGLLMGLWHWGPDSWKLLFLGHPLLAVSLPIGTIFGTVPLGVLMAFVYNNTNGSLLLPVLFHAAINSTFTLMDLAWPQVPFYIRYGEFAVGYIVLAVILVSIFGAQKLSRRQELAAEISTVPGEGRAD